MLNDEVRRQLIEIVGEAYFKDDSHSLVTHSYDGTPMLQALPNAVMYPENTAQVSSIIKVLNKYCIPLVSRGSGTNLCAGTVPVQGGVVLVMHRMNRLLEVDLENLTATVQPGMITKQFTTGIEELGSSTLQIRAVW